MNQLHVDTGSPLDGIAVVGISTFVADGRVELIQKIAVGRVKIDSVVSGLHRPFCRPDIISFHTESDSDIGEKVFMRIRSLRSFFRLLHERGLSNWKAVKAHSWLRPFAWIYQAFRYMVKGLKRENAVFKIKIEYEEAMKRKELFDALGVATVAKGPIVYKDGEYVKECGVFTLNADHALHIDITEEFSKKSGLPAGENSGTYVFLYRNEEWRYDKAETFQITIKGINYSFLNAVGTTNNKTLAFYLPDGDIVLFNKSEE